MFPSAPDFDRPPTYATSEDVGITMKKCTDSPVFDAHVHIFPDAVAEQAIAVLSARAGLAPFHNGTRAGLLDSMRRAGVDGALNCPIATKPGQVESINRWAQAANRWPVLSLGTVHPDYPHPEQELRFLHESGVPGIKLHPEYQEFELDDPRLDRVWAECSRLGLIVLLHTGADLGFTAPFHSTPASVRRLVHAWPDMKVIAAHFGGWEMWDRVEADLIGAPVYLDLSYTMQRIPDSELVRLVRAHGVERVLFATDTPWRDQQSELEHFNSLPFNPSEQRRILWDNAAKLFACFPEAPAADNA